MQKTLIAIAMLAAFGAAQAVTTEGFATGPNYIEVGGATIGGFHGPLGAPAIGEYGAGARISLQSIEPFTGAGTVSSGGVAFQKFQLLAGFNHPTAPGAPTEPTTVAMNGVKVPQISQQVYFGLATKETATPGQYAHQAWYVGDRDGYAVPGSTTNYAAVALLGLSGTSGSGLKTLVGTVQYDQVSNIVKSTGSHLTNGTDTLQITSSAISGGAFGGSSAYSGAAGTGTGNLNGKFFGSGATSALAGVAQGTSGTAYSAAFGGIRN